MIGSGGDDQCAARRTFGIGTGKGTARNGQTQTRIAQTAGSGQLIQGLDHGRTRLSDAKPKRLGRGKQTVQMRIAVQNGAVEVMQRFEQAHAVQQARIVNADRCGLGRTMRSLRKTQSVFMNNCVPKKESENYLPRALSHNSRCRRGEKFQPRAMASSAMDAAH